MYPIRRRFVHKHGLANTKGLYDNHKWRLKPPKPYKKGDVIKLRAPSAITSIFSLDEGGQLLFIFEAIDHCSELLKKACEVHIKWFDASFLPTHPVSNVPIFTSRPPPTGCPLIPLRRECRIVEIVFAY